MNPLLAGSTIFLGAFLLFQLQPMMAKAILPWFGGSAAVWGTCLVFFQSVLFLGYLYAHWLTRKVSAAKQPWVHGALLAISALLLPVLPSEAWKPDGNENPPVYILGLLLATTGLPYFLLSATSPLIQVWYSRGQRELPYRYFALSNAASLTALLGYPVFVEPNFSVRAQSQFWSGGYAVYAGICAVAGWLAVKKEPESEAAAAIPDGAPGAGTRSVWMLLAGLASVLSLAVTNHISQNVAPIPLLWVLPLAIYLISFIVTFESDRWYRRGPGLALHAAALAGMSYLLMKQTPESDVRWSIVALMAGLFVCCVFCHGELARRKPAAPYLSQFYLMIALGGALGAILVGLVAPVMLAGSYELAAAIAACALFTMLLEYRKWWLTDVALAGVAVGAFVAAGVQIGSYRAPARVLVRNFYGSVRVVDAGGRRAMVHGVVSHGTQFLDPGRRDEATTYYAPGTGVQRAIEAKRHPGQRVGVIGLGAGTLAAYGRGGDLYRFYEINPQVIDLARSEFSFLSHSKAGIEIVVGDGRLSLEREAPHGFDVLVVDAFSGDSVPVHLLSREAVRLYFRHTAEDGIVAFHVSNSALSLADVVRRAAEDLGYASLRISVAGDAAMGRSLSDWVLLARNGELFTHEAFGGLSSSFERVAGLRTWTDDYSTLFPILK